LSAKRAAWVGGGKIGRWQFFTSLMRIYISVDLEGINGVCHSSHTQPEEAGYERAVRLMHEEVNAVVRGAKAGGASEIVINDSHWDMRNIRHELLEADVTVVTGWQKPFSMVSGVSGKAGSAEIVPGAFDVAFFVGYHCMAGQSRGVLSHTYRAKVFADVKLNGRSVGETGLNAALAGHFGVPIGLLTGDDAVCDEARALLGDLECVAVKKAVSRYCAAFRPHKQVLDELEQAAMRVSKSKEKWRMFKPPSPSTLLITTIDPAMADAAELLPEVRRLDDRTVEFSHDDYSVLFRLMLAIGALGASRKDNYF
jgi:D-amino peptidase